MSSLRLTIHLLLACVWCGSLYYDVQYMPRIGSPNWSAKLVMLTNINFVLFVGFSVISLVTTITKSKLLQKVTSFCFYTSVFPLGVVTCALFWSLYAIDPEMVMPEWIRRLIPSWINHVTHSLPVLHLILELLLVKHAATSKRNTFLLSVILVSFYFGILFYVRHVDGYWLYPILTLFQQHHFVLIFILSVLGYFAICRLAVCLNNMVSGPSRIPPQKLK